MGRASGKSEVEGGFEQLRQALYDYYGALNEMMTLIESAPMMAQTIRVPEKPEALKLWEKCQALGLPLVAGGLVDQPHIWLEEVAIIRDIQQQFSASGGK